MDEDELIAHLAVTSDLYWILDDRQQERLFTLGLEDFGGAEADRQLAYAHTHSLRGEEEETIESADKARTAFIEMLKVSPDDSQNHSLMGISLAYLGRKEEAISMGREGVILWETSRDQPHPYCPLQLVRIYILLGEHDQAIDLILSLLEQPFYITPAWLGVDPMFDPLRSNPRFQALAE